MSTSAVLVLAALAASVVTLVLNTSRVAPLVAVAASGVEVLLRFGIVGISTRGVAVGLVLAAVLAVAGVLAWLRASGKTAVSAATIVVLVAGVQLLGALSQGAP